MGKFFNLDSPVMRFLSKMADIMILNILVLITIIPVITVGAAFSAMHYVLIKMSRNEDTYIFKMYFKAFKDNFKQGTLLWLIQLFLTMIFVFDLKLFLPSDATEWISVVEINYHPEFPDALKVAVFAIFILFLLTFMYVYPLQARFVNTVGQTLKNAFFIMILNLPKSIAMGVVYLMPIALIFLSSYATPFLIMFGISLPAYGAVFLYKKVFARFEPEAEKITDDMDFKVEVADEVSEGEAEVILDEVPMVDEDK